MQKVQHCINVVITKIKISFLYVDTLPKSCNHLVFTGVGFKLLSIFVRKSKIFFLPAAVQAAGKGLENLLKIRCHISKEKVLGLISLKWSEVGKWRVFFHPYFIHHCFCRQHHSNLDIEKKSRSNFVTKSASLEFWSCKDQNIEVSACQKHF